MERKAILVGVNVNNNLEDFIYSMQELGNLAAAGNVIVLGEMTQNLNQVNKSHYIGTGKIQELHICLKKKMRTWSFAMMSYHLRKFEI